MKDLMIVFILLMYNFFGFTVFAAPISCVYVCRSPTS